MRIILLSDRQNVRAAVQTSSLFTCSSEHPKQRSRDISEAERHTQSLSYTESSCWGWWQRWVLSGRYLWLTDQSALRRDSSLVAGNLHQLQVNHLILCYIFKLLCRSICRLISAVPLPGAHNQGNWIITKWLARVNPLQLGAELESLRCHWVPVSLILLNLYCLCFRHLQVFVSPGTV